MYRPKSIDSYLFYVEVSSACNLRCPSCPNGNYSDPSRPIGFIDVNLFTDILDKIERESPGKTTHIHLYNWGEPTLHPELPRLIELTRSKGMLPHLSSNLNAPRNLKDIIKARPESLRISLSGYFPATYHLTHQPGDIWLLKSNCFAVRAAMESCQIRFPVHFCYHKYIHNMGTDLMKAKALADELGFDFLPVWAYLAPLETLLNYFEGNASDTVRSLVQRMLIRPEEAREIALRHLPKYPDCSLKTSQVAIDFDGTIALCCAAFARANYIPGHFLDLPLAQIQDLRERHSFCKRCIQHGGYLYYLYAGADELGQVAENRLQKLREELFSGV